MCVHNTHIKPVCVGVCVRVRAIAFNASGQLCSWKSGQYGPGGPTDTRTLLWVRILGKGVSDPFPSVN